MAGYYIPSTFSANYVTNKKNEDGTYVYDSAINRAGIDAQRNLQQLNKQYNVSLNSAQAQGLLANRGLRSSMLGSGYKAAYAQRLQESVNQEMSQVGLSVQEAKQGIFQSLSKDVSAIVGMQQQEINNMRRMAGSLEQYHTYLQGLSTIDGKSYVADQGFKIGNEWTFEDNYDKLFGTQKGIIGNYLDENSNVGLSWEDWLRQNSGSSDDDTNWLDWVYNGGADQYKNFIKKGIKTI